MACSAKGNLNHLAARLGVTIKVGISDRIEATYDYVDEQGECLFQVVKLREPKDFNQRRPDGPGGWIWNLTGVRRVLYRLPQLLAADPEETVFIVEGEKDADNLARLGLVATTNPGGAGKWRTEYGQYLAARSAVILPDNDDAGRGHAPQVSKMIADTVAELKVVCLPGLPEKGDVSDWIAAGGTKEDLLALVAASMPLTTAPLEPSGEAEVEGDSFVDGSSLLTRVEAMIRRFVVLTAEQAHALALWVVHTYVMEAAECTPYVNITSAEKQSGKTRLLEVLALLVSRPWFTARVTAAVLVRKVSAVRPTLLLDESDAAFGSDKEYAETLRGVLNAGWRRGGAVSLCVKKGGGYDYQDFDVFSPKAIAGIGDLPDTVRDRAIVVSLRRRAPSESVERFRGRDADQNAAPLREQLEAWAAANGGSLFDRRAEIPKELDDRAADCWEPLLVIADAVGGDWPELARAAAQALSGGARKEDASPGVGLLGDIKSVFDAKQVARLATSELLDALNGMEEAPWGDLRGRPLDARGLARRLKPYGVRPKNLRQEEEKVVKGYEVHDFLDPWSRYIPQRSATSATSATATESESITKSRSVADVADVAANPVYAGAVQQRTGPDDFGDGTNACLTTATVDEWEAVIP